MKTSESILLDRGFRITHPEKPVWQHPLITKQQFIDYLKIAAPMMLPFLSGRALTVIRFPHGVPGTSFFQKNCPNYAPASIRTYTEDGTQYIVCDNTETLTWLGNQLAIEFHIPFQKAGAVGPEEIIFDLDPPERSAFSLAVKAAVEMKILFERLSIISFPKLSGSRGLQIHLPVSGLGFSYADTRLFTKFVADLLVSRSPAYFTTERLKKNRGGRLYIDYVQHAEGKTIISPYSPRGKEGATVAAPLFWYEVNDALRAESFTITTMLDRISKGINPMHGYFEQRNESLIPIIKRLKSST
ncbi:non-homologous end-joining DNA ligase [Sporolactobacillus shoreicorticis]|uniref:Non-homologous end-joining DNA ligase n=1 Tax=Sporolactobacillus shoreicorticis TaxID=1923877 RepID=A0ABW5RXQ3_9BACL|nr:non-homologous end-joining DNA ligase [Sporolactobacillus shoreicorticis]MCO7124745.1 non-homologous end-joining DNA ligase [Sporolactobacillus shoreicorticis]